MAGLTFGLTKSGDLSLVVCSGFLFSGLMFGPDLDIHSRQFIRWGWLRWIWIPYQKNLRHRSIISHGPIIGTIVRSIYLAVCVGVLGLVWLTVTHLLWGGGWHWQRWASDGWRELSRHYPQLIALFAGLELGAMSHSLSDWGGSTYKRFKKGGWKAVKPKVLSRKKRKHKNTQRPVKGLTTPRKRNSKRQLGKRKQG